MTEPTDAEVSAYRDLFRAELDKRMDTRHPSTSPSTESHRIALTAFLKARGAPATTAAWTDEDRRLATVTVEMLTKDWRDRERLTHHQGDLILRALRSIDIGKKA